MKISFQYVRFCFSSNVTQYFTLEILNLKLDKMFENEEKADMIQVLMLGTDQYLSILALKCLCFPALACSQQLFFFSWNYTAL